MKNASIFQILVMVFSGIFAVIALIMFSTYKGKGEEKIQPVTVWGIIERKQFDEFTMRLQESDDTVNLLKHVTYIQKDLETFDDVFVEALALGTGPDLVILPHERILRQSNKLIPLSYDTYSERLFQDSFVEGADILRNENGIYGLPLTIDPLVMYWNRDMFNRNLITEVPKTWETVLKIAPELSSTDDTGKVFKSAIALGQFSNVDYAKEILTTLIKQAGGDVVEIKAYDDSDGNFDIEIIPSLKNKAGSMIPPAESALRFFGQFSDPTKEVYSWNRSLSTDSQRFLSGDLAMYFGKISEYEEFKKINPNLNFDVAVIPQKTGGKPVTYGDFMAISIVKNSKYVSDAFKTLVVITRPEIATILSEILDVPAARRDVLAKTQPLAHKNTFFSSAIWAKAFYDPYPQETNKIFGDMVQLYTSGQLDLQSSIATTDEKLEVLYD